MINRKILSTALLLLILLLAAWLRLANVRDNPAWYSDEGTHLAIAGALAQGEQGYLAVSGPTLLFAKLPLFEGALALLLRCCGRDMATLRAFTGLLGVFSAGLLYVAVRHAGGGKPLALATTLALAVYPHAVLYSRFGFSYNLLLPFVLLAFIGLCHVARRGKPAGLLLAAGAVGLGLISDLLMGAYVPVLLWVVVQERRKLSLRLLLLAGLLLALPPFAYAAAMLLSAPDAFWFDLAFTLSRLGGVPLLEQVQTLAQNYTLLLLQDSWWMAGLIGLFLLPRRLRTISLLFLFLPLLVLGRSEALFGLSAYYTIPLLPFVALGVGALLRYGVPAVIQRLNPDRQGYALPLAALLVAIPLLVSTLLTAQQVRSTMPTAIDPFLVPGSQARAAAAYVNAHLAPGDLVLASPAVAWLVQGQVADFQMAVAAAGRATPHLPSDLPPQRWSFDPRFPRARFVVVDDLWHSWAAVHVPGVPHMLEEVAAWSLRLDVGGVQVYERP